MILLIVSILSGDNIKNGNICIAHLQLTTCGGDFPNDFFSSEKLRSSKSQGPTIQTAAKHCDTPALALFLDHFCRCGSPRLSVMPRVDWGASADTHTLKCCPWTHSSASSPSNTTAGLLLDTQHNTKIIFRSLMRPMEVRVKDWPATGRCRG